MENAEFPSQAKFVERSVNWVQAARAVDCCKKTRQTGQPTKATYVHQSSGKLPHKGTNQAAVNLANHTVQILLAQLTYVQTVPVYITPIKG